MALEDRPRRFRIGLLQRALRARKPGGAGLEQLKSSGRPLLFSLLPRMLRDDGRTAESLQHQFRYVESNAAVVGPPPTVSARRWHNALATSRAISRRRGGTDRQR
jgi:hypothetical protein